MSIWTCSPDLEGAMAFVTCKPATCGIPTGFYRWDSSSVSLSFSNSFQCSDLYKSQPADLIWTVSRSYPLSSCRGLKLKLHDVWKLKPGRWALRAEACFKSHIESLPVESGTRLSDIVSKVRHTNLRCFSTDSRYEVVIVEWKVM